MTIQERLLHDHRYLIETFMSIRTESSGIKPFIFREVQNRYWDSQTKADIILKSRRDGFSSLKLAQGLALAMTRQGWHSKIVAHTPNAYAELKEAQDIMFDSLPTQLKPKVERQNAGELYFKKLDSKVTVANAGATEPVAERVGRSENINFLHLSEFAFYAYPATTYNSLVNCVPPDGIISIESTANGFNEYKKFVDEARRGEGNFKLHFFRWFDSKRNKVVDEDERFDIARLDADDSHADDEKKLIDEHGLSIEQIRWRRWKVGQIGLEKFKQEYPEDVETCFRRSGNCFFDIESLDWQDKNNVLSPITGYKNGVRIFEEPKPGHSYVVGVDIAEGNADSDFCSASFCDRSSSRQVAHIHGRWRPGIFAHMVAECARFYNDAFIGPERNNHGHAFILALLETEGYPESLVYEGEDGKLGWITNRITRPVLLDEYYDALLKKELMISCSRALIDHYSFIDKPGGPEASQGAFDDAVISNAIAYQMLKQKVYKQAGW